MSGGTGQRPPASEIVLYQTEDGKTRIQCRFEDDTIWLTQALIGELFEIGVGTVNHHLKDIYKEAELTPEATIRRYRMVRTEGNRSVFREIEHYNTTCSPSAGASTPKRRQKQSTSTT